MSIFKIIENSKFLNRLYLRVKRFNSIMYIDYSKEIINKNNLVHHVFNEKEITGLIIILKILFQHIDAYFKLSEEKLYLPAFNEHRSIYEFLRLLKVYIQDKEFRVEYLQNRNIDFRKTRDDKFIQSNIVNRLEKIEQEHRNQEKIILTSSLNNHFYTKGSNFSEIHSELSKFSHGLNVNLIFPLFIDENRIDLAINSENTIIIEIYLKKYLESLLIVLLEIATELHSMQLLSNKILEKEEELLKDYEEYIQLFYKKI